jgi:hypothetical protein
MFAECGFVQEAAESFAKAARLCELMGVRHPLHGEEAAAESLASA